MKILIIFNDDTQTSDEEDSSSNCFESRKSIQGVALHVAAALKKVDYKEIEIAPIQSLADIEQASRIHSPDLIFNLCESLNGDAAHEIAIVECLESLNIPFTGNNSKALAFALDKFECNQVLAQADIPVPHSFLIESLNDLASVELKHPKYIIKPNNEDGSTGIDDNSVVENIEQLFDKVKSLYKKNEKRLIVQEFIGGREINFAFLGDSENIHWCTSEIIFDPTIAAKHNILCYASKWSPNSDHFKRSKSQPVILSDELKERMMFSVSNAAKVLGINSYARIDFKVDDHGSPYIIDVNPNCDLDPSAGMSLANNFVGVTYEQLVRSIVLKAME
tara:strand:- start:3602 stop:4603 length:1002 start_codon:yes stop_codon:yes gene_type:complete